MQTRFPTWSLTSFCDSGVNGQFWADLKCYWPLRFPIGVQLSLLWSPALSLLCFADSPSKERDLGEITWHSFLVVVLPCRFPARFHSIALLVGFSPRFFLFPSLGAIWVLHFPVCALHHLKSHFTARFVSVEVGIQPARPLCCRQSMQPR